MAIFLTLTDSNVFDPNFWAGQNITPDSTINASAVSDTTRFVLTGDSLTVIDTTSGTSVTFDVDPNTENPKIGGGSFSNIVAFRGNNADNQVSGAARIGNFGYVGGTGNDTFVDDGSTGGQISGGDGDDTLVGGTGSNNIDGGEGDDLIRGGSGNNNLRGGDGNDTLLAEDGSGNLEGGRGDDQIVSSINTSFVDGGEGDDSLLVPEGATVTPFSPGATGGTVIIPLDDGSTRQFTYLNIAEENIAVICFAAGTQITTAHGRIAVEHLSVGDHVMTLENGLQPLRWIGSKTVPAIGPLTPIRFATGAVGNDRPLYVSPNHRMLLNGWACEVLFEEDAVLCAAKHLCDGGRIRRDPRPLVTYFHLMFDRHQIIFAEGAAAESLYVGNYQMRDDPALYDELITLFPELTDPSHPTRRLARPEIRAFEAAALKDMADEGGELMGRP